MRRVVEAQELERARLARELHDETGQALTSILLGLKPLEQAADVAGGCARRSNPLRELVVSTLQNVRRLAVELRPTALDDFGLVPAVERLVDTFREQSGLTVDLETQLGDARLPAEAETTLYRVVQEALTNIVKHAGRRPASASSCSGGTAPCSVVVEDDGAGFDPAATREDALGPRRHARAGGAGRRQAAGRVDARRGHYACRRGAGPVTIRVLIVDDHAVVRTGLRRVLDADDEIETVGEAPDAERAVFEAIETKPDVVLLDVMMPGKSGIEGMPALLQAVPDTKVLVLSMQDDPHYVREAFDAGASGYVLKEAADTEVVSAVKAVAAGERYVHPSLGAKLFAAEAEERRRAERDPALGPRARGAPPAHARPHQPGDREDALHLRPHRRDAPGAHHAEAAAAEPGRARALRDRGGPARPGTTRRRVAQPPASYVAGSTVSVSSRSSRRNSSNAGACPEAGKRINRFSGACSVWNHSGTSAARAGSS